MRGRVLMFLLACAACGKEPPPPASSPPPAAPALREPKRVLIEQIHIAFKGAKRQDSPRPKAEARRLAYSLLEKVESGIGFELLKQQYSDDRDQDDRANSPYIVVNFDTPHAARRDNIPEIPRASAYRSWGDLAFALKPGEVGIADYNEKDCPSGWHIMKRLK